MTPSLTLGPGVHQEGPCLLPAGAHPRTALAVDGGRARHLGAHLARLQEGADALGQSAPWLPALRLPLEGWLQGTAGEASPIVLRMSLDLEQTRLLVRLEVMPPTPAPYRLVPLPHPFAGEAQDPLLRHKGLRGPWEAGALAEARAGHGQDGLLVWPDGHVAESCIAAVALERPGLLLVPPPEGRVASVAEQLDLPSWASARNLEIRRAGFDLEAARRGRLWCLNAVRGIWPATVL